MASALPSNALYDVQRYLRQKRATGAQVTPQNERSAWSGYFDTMAQNSLAERASAMNQERLNMTKDALKAQEGADQISGVGQLVSTVGQGAMLLKGTDIGGKIGLGTAAPPQSATPTAPIAASGTPSVPGTGAGLTTTSGAGVPATASDMTAISGGEAIAPAAGEAGGGMMTAATPLLGSAGAAFTAGSVVPGMLGFKKGAGELAAGAVSGAAAGAAIGTISGGPYGTAVGAVIGAVAGAVGSKIK